MADHTTQVSTEFCGAESVPADVSLVLEQEPWPIDSGAIKTMQQIATENGLQFVGAFGGTLISGDIDEIYRLYYAQCGAGADGSLTATINVFTTPDSLDYNLVASYGEFNESAVTGSSIKEESVNFNLNVAVDVGYKIESVESLAWEGDVFNASGSVIQISVPSVSGTQLIASEPVLGTCRIKYKVFGKVWELNVPKRDDAAGNEYSSTVHAFYGNGQVETLNITGPSLTGGCGQTVEVCVDEDCEQDPDDDGEEDGTGDGSSVALQLSAFDYCTGSAISGAKFYIGGKEVSATGHTVKRGSTYSIKVTASGYKDSSDDDLDNDSFSV